MNNMVRRNAFISMSDSDDEDSGSARITSYCTRCEKNRFYRLLGERIYDINEPMTSDHDNWLQCNTSGILVAKVHAKRQDETVGMRTDHSILDNDKVVIKSLNAGKYPSSKKKTIHQVFE
jgi:hypothetical protein